ncbi:hypothetical protein R6Q57_024127, partial [Mikania cordata]
FTIIFPTPSSPDRKIPIAFSFLTLIVGSLIVFSFIGDDTAKLVCTSDSNNFRSTIVPQQSLAEISISFNVLKSISPVTSSSSASVTIPSLSGLPDLVYDKEWDMIMIDTPRGCFAEAPGRMGAIYSVAVMARNRKN